MLEKKNFRIGKGQSLDMWISKNESDFFSPNDVTGFLADQADIKPNDVVFELGSGISPISILLAKKQPELKQIYCVEIVPEQINLAIQNIEKYQLSNKITPLQGDLFSPIENQFPELKANVILDDCSGLSPIAAELGWYPKGNKIPQGGADGTAITIPFLQNARHYLAEFGSVYFPTTPNFSDEQKIIDAAQKCFGSLEVILEKKIPLTKQQTEQIMKTSESNIFEPILRKGTRGFWVAKIWRARNPINPI
jgi:hypothetical protein